MVAEEKKAHAVLKKRIKRLGMYQILFEDMTAYQAYHDGKMTDIIPTDEDLEKGFATIPNVE